jgi:hypothetical protein
MVTHSEKRKRAVEDIVSFLLTKCSEADPESAEVVRAQAALNFCMNLTPEDWGIIGRLAGHYKTKGSVPNIRTRFAVHARLEAMAQGE